jgi:hypothetical protein
MKQKRSPAIVTALKSKAAIVRNVAAELNFTYVEKELLEECDVVKFIFELDEADQRKLLAALPIEVFAYRAVIGGTP